MLRSLLLAVAIGAQALAQCVPHWEPVGFAADTTAVIRAQCVFDDGTGPAHIIGGEFTHVNNVPCINIAKLSNSGATPLGSGLTGSVSALTAFDSGSGSRLYAAGNFYIPGIPARQYIACWDGTHWQPLASGLDNRVYVLAAHNDGSGNALYAGGLFTHADSLPAAAIARWNGTSWSSVGASLGTGSAALNVSAILSTPDGLYVGGNISSINGSACTRVVRWNGVSWQSVGAEASSTLQTNALAFFDNGAGTQLFRGGQDGIQYLSGSSWTSLDPNFVTALTVFPATGPGQKLYAALSSTRAIKTFAGASQETIPLIGGPCNSLAQIPGEQGPVLCVTGSFARLASQPIANIAAFVPSSGWSNVANVGGTAFLSDYLPAQDGASAYVGLTSATYFNGTQGTVAKLQNGVATPLPTEELFSGFTNRLEFLPTPQGPTLIAAGYVVPQSTGILRVLNAWHNDSPAALPPGVRSGNVYADDLFISHRTNVPSLYVAGRFNVAFGTYNALMELSATGFSSLTAEPSGFHHGGRIATRPTANGEVLYVTELPETSSLVARSCLRTLEPGGPWTFTTPSLLSQNGSAGSVSAAAWFHDDQEGHVYLGGSFDSVDGHPAQCLARVVNNVVQPVAGITGPFPFISDMCVFDDGTGPALYITGAFTAVAGTPASRIARLRNGVWESLGTGLWTPYDDNTYAGSIGGRFRIVSDTSGQWLYVTGSFETANGMYSPKVARYGICSLCPADYNRDGVADFFDYLDFVSAFAVGQSTADVNRDGTIDFFDYLDFVNAFAAGC